MSSSPNTTSEPPYTRGSLVTRYTIALACRDMRRALLSAVTLLSVLAAAYVLAALVTEPLIGRIRRLLLLLAGCFLAVAAPILLLFAG